MIIRESTAICAAPGTDNRHRQTASTFAATLAQYAPSPLFAVWPVISFDARSTASISNAALTAHPSANGRREGRHARG
jgi:hypothetical protein